VLWYGALEFGVGVYACLAPLLFGGLGELVGWLGRPLTEGASSLVLLTLLRFLLAALVVLPPTIAMGLSFPLLTGWLRGLPGPGGMIGRLYTVNTLGAAAGTLLSSYLLIGSLGLWGVLGMVFAINTCVLAVCYRFPRDLSAPVDVASSPEAPSADSARSVARNEQDERWLGRATIYVLAASSGFLTLGFEVVWSHLLATVVGTSTYAFGLVLAIFLCALALGGGIITLYVADLPARRVAAFLAASLLLAGWSLSVTLSFWDSTSTLFVLSGYFKPGFWAREATRAVAVMALIFVPALLMGFWFPTALAMQRTAGAELGRRVGLAYALNTAGTILGSTLVGFGLIQWLGSQATLRLLGACTLLLGFPWLRALERWSHRLGFLLLGLWALGSLAWAEPWDMVRMNSGANIYFASGFDLGRHRLVHFAEDVHGGMTTVVSDGDVRTLMTNGKFEGNNGRERTDQILIAAIPNLYVARRERALNIGIGTGQTMAVLHAFGYRDVDAVDISPNIVEAARRFFDDVNLGVFAEKNSHVYYRDGRNHLLLTDRRYDLISIELTSVWFASAGNLYSQEFYRLCQRRLAPGGVVQQWIQLHHIELEDVATIVRTLSTVFPAVELWMGGHQGVLVASERLREPDTRGLFSVSAQLSKLLSLAEVTDARQLLEHRLVTAGQMPRVLRAIERDPGRVSTDSNLVIEYSTPRGNALDGAEAVNLQAIKQALAALH
jgi:spermidine synthase